MKYIYTVRVYDTINKYYASYYDTVGVGVGDLGNPAIYEINDRGSDVKIDFKRNPYATGYILYRRTDGTSWVKIKSANISSSAASSTSYFTDKTVESGETYYYTMIVYDGKRVSSFDPIGEKCVKK